MNRLMSHVQAIRSIFGLARVTHRVEVPAGFGDS